jgi:diguanylate cyclase (GGDEF)-like protein
MDLREATNRVSKPVWVGLGFMLLAGVAYLDYITGVELSFSLFYLIPISLLSWVVRERFGVVIAFLSAGIWLMVDVSSGAKFSNTFVYFWNAIIRLGFFLLPVFIIRLRRAMESERELARTDFLTGTFNSRSFHELAQMEIDRSARYKHPFTIAFIDIDNFKTINDTHGHAKGDIVLRTIANSIQQNVRKTDIVARVGGDEFAILLPETDMETAPTVISNMQRKLLDEMQKNNWPVTLSVGVLSLAASQLSVDEMLGIADQMMYAVKNGGKNNIYYDIYPNEKSYAHAE